MKKEKKSSAQRRFARGKTEERNATRSLLGVDGLPEELELKRLITSTGRVASPKLGFDGISKHYCIEVKSSSRKAKNPGCSMTKKTFLQIQEKAKSFKKDWVYIIKIANCKEGHMISKERHGWLLSCERDVIARGNALKVRQDFEKRVVRLTGG